MGLMADLGPGPVAIDTAVFIYFIDEDPRFLSLIDPLSREADQGTRELVTSALTLLEVLVVPYRAGNRLLADRYEALLTRSGGIRLVNLTRDQPATGRRPAARDYWHQDTGRPAARGRDRRRMPDVPDERPAPSHSARSAGQATQRLCDLMRSQHL